MDHTSVAGGEKMDIYIDPDTMFLYEVKCALSNYIQSKECDERQGLLMLNEIMKELIDDYIERTR